MKKRFMLLCFLSFIGIGISFAQTRVTGNVVDESGDPVIGAAVLIKGSGQGTSTDANGKFTLNVPKNYSTLVVSFVGMRTQEVAVKPELMIVLQADTEQLEELVVTAMGIKKTRKALGYAVSDLDSRELMKNKNTNVINSLNGKVPGINITQSSGAAGAGASITIRGGNSTSEGRQNQPLFVVDGVIYDNSTTVVGNSGTDGMTRSNTSYSNRVMDINPEDIETMSVLKGAAAAALYGSRAADGVIIITTKKGSEGTTRVDVSSKLSTSWATKLPEAQTSFGRGYYENNGVFNDLSYDSWGEAIKEHTQVYNNIGSFFQHGVVYDNNVNISSGNKNGTFYLSASNYNQTGIVPQTGYDKTTFRLNGEQKYGRLTINANAAYSIAMTEKTLTSAGLYDSGGNGTMTALYQWPITEKMSQYLNDDGTKYRLFEGRQSLADDLENPYWIINKNKINDKTKRFTGSLGGSFDIADWWNISSRIGYDQYTTATYGYIAPGAAIKEIYQNGRLSKNDYNYTYMTTNVMSNFHKTVNDFDFNLLLGSTTENTEYHNQTHWGYDFVTAGTISFSNILSTNQFFKDATTLKRLIGVYGEFRTSYKNIAYVTITGRNDWSSTIPDNKPYFYPSVSGSFVFTEILPKNRILSFGKLRGSWARVGKDASPYATLTYLTSSPIIYGPFVGVGNYYSSGNPYLKPELQTSWEIGGELRFFKGRLGMDYTYYHSQTKNQIASPRLSNANGYIMSSINSGSVINDGMELAITGKPIVAPDFEWDITLNSSYNRGRLGEFLKGVEIFYPTDAQFGTIKAASVPNGGDFLALIGTRFAYETQKIDGKDVEIKSGRFQVDPQTGLYKISSATSEVVGNREPKFIGGLNNSIRYKDLTVSLLMDFRIGGDVYNGTEYYMVANGSSKRTINRQSVTVTGVNSQTGEVFNQTYEADKSYTIGGVTYSGKAMIQKYWANYLSHSPHFITSVNWLKLRSFAINYDFSKLISKQRVIKGLGITVTGTNLLTLTNYQGMDPEVSVAGGTGGSGATGIDYCSVPSTAGLTFGVNITF